MFWLSNKIFFYYASVYTYVLGAQKFILKKKEIQQKKACKVSEHVKSRPPDKIVYWTTVFFLISQAKYMLWVLKRTVSIRRLFRAPKTHV